MLVKAVLSPVTHPKETPIQKGVRRGWKQDPANRKEAHNFFGERGGGRNQEVPLGVDPKWHSFSQKKKERKSIDSLSVVVKPIICQSLM